MERGKWEGGNTMTLHERLRQIIEPLPPGASVVLPRDAIEQWLDSEDAYQLPAEADSVIIDLTIRQVASLMGKKESTVRGWLNAGAMPGAYKLHGREWRIPREELRRFQERQRVGTGPEPRGTSRPPVLGAWRSEMRVRAA